MPYARIIVSMNTPQIDRVFDYAIPQHFLEMAQVGVRVIVPFGRRNVKTEGYILSLSDETDVPLGRIKEVLEVLDHGKPIFTPTMIALSQWLKERYFCTLSQCLQTVMPSGIQTKSKWFVQCGKEIATDSLKGIEKEVMEFVEDVEEIPLLELENQFGNGVKNALYQLEKKGYLQLRQSLQRATYEKTKKTYTLNQEFQQIEVYLEKIAKDKRLLGQRDILSFLQEKATVSLAEIKELEFSLSAVKTLCKKGILLEQVAEEKRDVFSISEYEATTKFIPTSEQATVLQEIERERNKADKTPILLHGVTGSGKTEIYLQTIAQVLAEGKQAIVLVPEISLTPQILGRFISRFGDKVSVTHSRLSAGERLDQWKKARDGEISVMIGPRSALFMPFENLGIVIIDEVHENTYVSDVTPKYDAREVATQLAKETDALLLFGSATPSVAMYYKALQGEYKLLELKERTAGGSMPQMHIADMCLELENGNRSAFSQQLQVEIAKNLEKGEQTILFLNRRGYATFVSCRSCGFVMKCSDCNMPYTYHAKDNSLMCHYCGKTEESPKICPSCGSKYIRYFGTGTQKIEEEAQRLFPKARILRMDMDTTTGKDSHQKILRAFENKEADILVGTQLIAKGHDFPNVTLVGIMAADTSLYTGGYTSAETTFGLITQAAGRAGRGEANGRVIIQTYQKEHYSIVFAKNQDYIGFYEEEILLREVLGYPPFGSFFSILLTGEKEAEVSKMALELASILEEDDVKKEFLIMGPTRAQIYYYRGEYRMRIMLQGSAELAMVQLALQSVERLKKDSKTEVRFNLTLNPLNVV